MGFNDFLYPRMIFLLFMLLLPGMILGGLPNDYEGNSTCKYLKNYSPEDYLLQPQNWCIIQDQRGIIYAANQGGLLEFDGIAWKEIVINNSAAYSLAIDDSGTIYVGGRDEIGFLAPDSKETLTYRSLVSHLDNNRKSFGPVWKIHATKEGIYYCTLKFLFRWSRDSQKIKVWEPGSDFSGFFTCNGKLYLCLQKVGLMQMINDSPVLLPGGEIFAHDNICMMVPYDEQRLLLGTRSKGFYLYDGAAFTPFAAEADAYLEEKQLYFAVRLSDGNFALATRSGGLVIMDAKGKLKEIVDKSSGLQDNSVWHAFEDFQGNLWLALNKGITKIEYASPFSIYDEKCANLPGIVISVARHGPQQELYAGTTNGLFSLTPGRKFRPVPGMSDICWSLLSIGDSLLAATKQGIFRIKNNIPARIIDKPSYVLSRSRQNTNRIWAGTREGLISLGFGEKTGRWTEEYKYENINREIRTIEEDPHGNLWLGTLTQGVLNVRFPVPAGAPGAGAGKTAANPVAIHYGPAQGLPKGETHVFSAAGHIMFATEKGLYRFDKKKNRFIPDPVFGKEFADGSRSVFRIAEDHHKNTWFHSRQENFQAVPQADGTYKINKKIFRRIIRTQVNAIYPDPAGQFTWFATHKGLIRYDPSIKKNSDLAFQTLIRKVRTTKTLIFGGSKSREDKKAGARFPLIDYEDRNLWFEFAAPFFGAESEIMYQCMLEGYDKDRTAWSGETKKEYTNLDSGLYTFRVRAQNVYGTIGREDSFRFKIVTPWFKTWWAFSIYAAAVFFIMFFIVKWRSRKLVREKQRLEQIILERTKEIKQQSEKLEEMANVKSRFFANISHEFRTPLTLIMGPLEKMLSSCRRNEQARDLRLMLRNSRRLLGLINQLLELSKFDSGKIKLQAIRQDIVPFLKGILHAFDSLAVQNDQTLEFRAGAAEIILYFDPARLEEMIANLLANAVKFTPAGGEITLAVKVNKHGPEQGNTLEISVRDTGPGIPEHQLAHIFDRFYQADGTYEHHRKGSGIGLSIAREIVELHHGTIAVHSRREEPSGTEFVVRLPMGDAHLEPGEIVEAAEAPQAPGAPRKIPGLYMMDADETGGPDIPAENEEAQARNAEYMITDADTGKDIILVVEDSADMREYIRGALEPLYAVVEAGDGEQGLEKAGEIVPDLIICDVMMPGKDGFEVCREIKGNRITSHIPVILLTARAGDENILTGLETGADDYITKPFNTKILIARIKNLIELRRQMQLMRKRRMALEPAEICVTSIDETFYKELQGVIEANLDDTDFNVEAMSKKLYMNRATLYRKIHALTGETPTDFIRSYRLKRAAQLLKAKVGNVTEVSFRVGFSTTAYFTKCFKDKFHRVPSDFPGSEGPGDDEKSV
jgi:signal transduction histidine kinase/DNA-binding response OmpR family regulator